MPGYDYVFHRAALLGVLACEDAHVMRLFNSVELLAEAPHRAADFYGRDAHGRLISWMKVGDHAVGYVTNHSRRSIQILDVRQAVD